MAKKKKRKPESPPISEPSSTPPADHRPLWAVLLTVILLAPFLNKPFHIDDTYFLRVAAQILKHPFNPYDFEYNWFTSPLSVWLTMQHPPLNCYLLALVELAARGSEILYHIFYLGLAAGCALLMLALAKGVCREALLATALTLVTPCFWVSASNVMADVPLLFFWLLAVYFTIRATQVSRECLLWWAGLAAAATALTKYFGIAVLPLLLAYWIIRTRRFTVHLIALLLPVLALLVWGWHSKVHANLFHPLAAAGYSKGVSEAAGVLKLGNTFVYFGGTLLWPVFLLPLAACFRRPAILVTLGLMVLTVILCRDKIPAPVSVYWIPMAIGGMGVMAMGVASCFKKPDSDSALLGLWLLGTFAFALFFNWTLAARVILPAAFPAAVLAIRWIESLDTAKFWLKWTKGAFAATAAISLVVALADHELASASRTFAQTTIRDLKQTHKNIYFAGHWGLQYYMEREGARPFNFKEQTLQAGALVVIPYNNSSVKRIGVAMQPIAMRDFPNPYPVHTMCGDCQAGFYSSVFGPLPFGPRLVPEIDKFLVFEVQ